MDYLIKIALFCIGLVVVNIFYARNPILGIPAFLGFILALSSSLGQTFLTYEKRIFRILFGFLLLLALLAILGSVCYYFWGISQINVSLILAIALLLVLILSLVFQRQSNISQAQTSETLKSATAVKRPNLIWPLLNIVFCAGIGFEILLLVQARTYDAVVSPWRQLPLLFFLIYFLTTSALLTVLWRGKTRLLSVIFLILQSFTTLGIALVIYGNGYGFDQFIHQAAEKYIIQFGSITPRSLYYIGQYSIVTILAYSISAVPQIIDKILVPILASIYLPFSIFYFLNRGLGASLKISFALVPLAFFLPFSTFIATTPQGLANLFLIVAVLLSYSLGDLSRTKRAAALAVLGIAALLIHPLSGIPLIFFLIISAATRTWLKILIFLLAAITLPLSFALLPLISQNTVSALLSSTDPWITFKTMFENASPQKSFNFFLDLIYAINIWLIPAFLLISLAGIFIAKIKKRLWQFTPLESPAIYGGDEVCESLIPYRKNEVKAPLFLTGFSGSLFIFIALIINYFLTKIFIKFPALIEYEQADYVLRIKQISFYFLLPFFFLFFSYTFEKIKNCAKLTQAGIIMILSIALTSTLYFSYPRDDSRQIGHAWSVGKADIEAIKWIEKDSGGESYIILANQSVCAAALQEFGFQNRYIKTSSGEIFYCSIPTGGPLYQYYLQMVGETPSAEIIKEAAELAQKNLVYFVINGYWTDNQKIIEQTKLSADSWQTIDNGKVAIFKYKLTPAL